MSDHGAPGIELAVDGAAAVPLDSPLQLAGRLRSADALLLTAPHGRIEARRDGEGWRVEATGDGRRRARTPNTDAAYDLLRSWCNGDGWWQEAFGWVEN